MSFTPFDGPAEATRLRALAEERTGPRAEARAAAEALALQTEAAWKVFHVIDNRYQALLNAARLLENPPQLELQLAQRSPFSEQDHRIAKEQRRGTPDGLRDILGARDG